MKILLVNDDGYRAEGINVLDKVLSEYGHTVEVIAPSVEQSGKSHSMTLYGSKILTKYGDNRYHVDGTPVDCIIYGTKSKILQSKPDLVISGINHGYNLSTDITYSGTCGAARQAALYGYKAIAISEGMVAKDKYHFDLSARFLADNLDYFVSLIEEESFLNINIPNAFSGKYEYASIGAIDYDDEFSVEDIGDDKFIIKNTGCKITYKNIDGGVHPNDFEICQKGNASVSLVDILPSCLTHHMERW